MYEEHVEYDARNNLRKTDTRILTRDSNLVSDAEVGNIRDQNDNCYWITDGALLRRTSNGEVAEIANGFPSVIDIALGPNGTIYLTDFAAVIRVTQDGKVSPPGGNPFGVSVQKSTRG